MTATPVWLVSRLILRLHAHILEETGGAAGVRDEGLLASAIARPVNRYLYDGITDLIELAATYAVAVASNHPFVDGNKRSAFMALGLFLDDNGLQLATSNEDAAAAILEVAAGRWDIDQLTTWLRPRVVDA